MIWNKELAILPGWAPPATCTVAMQQSSFLHRSRASSLFVRRTEARRRIFPGGPRAYKVIVKYDGLHQHFQLDFLRPNGHCDLVQCNNVT